ncbi:FGGY-family carbohydrate kinase [Amycolatopsis suaedae]|uniref:FGGY-family carbohydrate kinase n=1 Tax=Amycolatopsis suaedae TaxID=2510978 RepID=UPI0030B856CA
MSGVTIGIDVGTSRVRTLAVDGSGAVLASATSSHPPPSERAGGHREQDARGWWPAVERSLCELTAVLPRHDIGAVAVTTPSGIVVPVDRRGEPAGPALLAGDVRGAEYNRAAAHAGAARWRRLGLAVKADSAIGRIAWLAGNQPRLAGVRHPADLVTARLTGRDNDTSSAHAVACGYDPLGGEWPTEVLDALKVGRRLLPRVVAPGTRIGKVSRLAAALTGLPVGCPVVAGVTEGYAQQLASGAVTPGQFVGILGSRYRLRGVTEGLVPDPSGTVSSQPHPDGWWLPGGASNTGDAWLPEDSDRLDAAACARGPAGIVAYPLRGSGERFPFASPEAHGFTSAEPADEVELHRARVEGVAFVERLALDHLRRLGIPVTDPLLAAGDLHSPLWTQVRATVTGLGVRPSPHAEPAYGAALLALGAIVPGGLIEACSGAAGGTVVEPVPGEQDAMTESYHRFCTELHARGWIDDELFAVATR